MVSSLRNRGTVFQELRYPKTGMAVQSGQDSSDSKHYIEQPYRGIYELKDNLEETLLQE